MNCAFILINKDCYSCVEVKRVFFLVSKRACNSFPFPIKELDTCLSTLVGYCKKLSTPISTSYYAFEEGVQCKETESLFLKILFLYIELLHWKTKNNNMNNIVAIKIQDPWCPELSAACQSVLSISLLVNSAFIPLQKYKHNVGHPEWWNAIEHYMALDLYGENVTPIEFSGS